MPTITNTRSLLEQVARVRVMLYRQSGGSGIPTWAGGYYEPLLAVENIRFLSGGKYNYAIISMGLSDWLRMGTEGPTKIRMEHFRRYVGVDDYVRIVLGDYLIFDGFIANPVIGSERGQAERVELTVIGKEVRLDDGIVAGLMVRTPVHDAEVLAGSTTETVVGTNTVEVDLPLIFNPNNRPNATARKATITRTNAIKVIEAEGPVRPTVEVRLFEDVEREHIRATAVYWTLAEAMKYIIYQYNDELYVANPEAEVIDNLFLDTPISNVDLTGTRNLFKEVLPKLLAGTRFSFMVSRNRLIFWDKERGRGEGFIHLDRPGTAITEAGASNVAGVVLGRNTLAAANEIEVQGDFQYVQGGFLYDSNDLGTRDRTADNGSDLIEAWKVQTAELDKYFDAEGNFLAAGDDEVLTTEFMGRFNTEGDQFNYGGYGYCFRHYALNENAEYNEEFNGFIDKGAYDLSGIFRHSNYQVRRRRFYQTIERMEAGPGIRHFNPRVMISFDSGDNWQNMTDFMVASEQCAITITTPDLRMLRQELPGDTGLEAPEDRIHWIQALYNKTLMVWVYACIRDDTRITAMAGKRDNAASRFNVKHRVVDPLAYRYRRVLTGESNRIGDGAVDEMREIDKAGRTAAMIQEVMQDGVLEGRPAVQGLAIGLEPGMKIKTVAGRDITLATNKLNEVRYPTVVGVELRISGEQMTRIELDVSR